MIAGAEFGPDEKKNLFDCESTVWIKVSKLQFPLLYGGKVSELGIPVVTPRPERVAV